MPLDVRESLIAELREVVSAEALLTVPDDLAGLERDRSRVPGGRAAALVRPRNTAEVQAIVRIADRHGAPIVAQGARTSLAGAAAAVEGAILIDFADMNRILRIDPVERLAVVQPGVLVADLAAAVEREGLFYAPDPVSSQWASLGGTIATNAGGMRCIKYGVTRESIRSLEVVLADGSAVRTRRDTIKSVTGLDLTSLVIGSEGTLALVTEATVSLHAAPGPSRGNSAMFDSIGAASPRQTRCAVRRRRRCCWNCSTTSHSPRSGPSTRRPTCPGRRGRGCSPSATPVWAPTRARLLRADLRTARRTADATRRVAGGAGCALRRASRAAPRAGRLRGGVGSRRHRGPAVRTDRVRRSCRRGLGAIRHRDLDRRTRRRRQPASGRRLRPGRCRSGRALIAATDALLAVAQDLGGTISGEHGIGTQEKLHALDGELSPRVRELQRAIKAAFDPKGLLNPGEKI